MKDYNKEMEKEIKGWNPKLRRNGNTKHRIKLKNGEKEQQKSTKINLPLRCCKRGNSLGMKSLSPTLPGRIGLGLERA